MIKVKNNKAEPTSWCGMSIEPSAYYEIQSSELGIWQNSSDVIVSISNGDLIVNNGTSDIADISSAVNLLKDIQPKDSSGVPIFRPSPFNDAGGFRFRGASFSGSAPTGTSTPIDFKIVAERFINGGMLIVDNIGQNDKITFQVVDVDNIFGYGAGVVLDEFIKDFFMPSKAELGITLAYPAKINAGLWLRLIYTSTHESGANIKCNLALHMKA